MLESKKDKRLRYLLLFICISFTIGALYYKYKNTEMRAMNPPLVTVLHQSQDKEDNPIIVIAKKQEGKYILAEYEVQMDNDYLFKTTNAVNLKGQPTLLSADKKDNGVWVRIDQKWSYFSRNLKLENRSPENRESKSAEQPYSIVKQEKGQKVVQIQDKQLELEGQEIKQIFSLAKDRSLWLIVTDREVIISTAQK